MCNLLNRDRVAGKTKQLVKRFFESGWHINITMLLLVNM